MTVEVPITVNRAGGFKDEIEISAAMLPPGVTADPLKSPGEGDASKSVKLVLKAAADTQSGIVRIVGKSTGEMSPPQTATFETAHGAARFVHRDVWIAAGK
jgi:hypothetical protein